MAPKRLRSRRTPIPPSRGPIPAGERASFARIPMPQPLVRFLTGRPWEEPGTWTDASGITTETARYVSWYILHEPPIKRLYLLWCVDPHVACLIACAVGTRVVTRDFSSVPIARLVTQPSGGTQVPPSGDMVRVRVKPWGDGTSGNG